MMAKKLTIIILILAPQKMAVRMLTVLELFSFVIEKG